MLPNSFKGEFSVRGPGTDFRRPVRTGLYYSGLAREGSTKLLGNHAALIVNQHVASNRRFHMPTAMKFGVQPQRHSLRAVFSAPIPDHLLILEITWLCTKRVREHPLSYKPPSACRQLRRGAYWWVLEAMITLTTTRQPLGIAT